MAGKKKSRPYIRPEDRKFNRPVDEQYFIKPVKTSGTGGHALLPAGLVNERVVVIRARAFDRDQLPHIAELIRKITLELQGVPVQQ